MLILDAVKDISSSIQKIVFVSINDSAALNCTVRAYPAILKNAVTVNHDGISFKEFSFTAIDNLVDGFLIELTFDSVEQNDYGSYYISLNNGLTDDSIIELQLLKKGNGVSNEKISSSNIFSSFFHLFIHPNGSYICKMYHRLYYNIPICLLMHHNTKA